LPRHWRTAHHSRWVSQQGVWLSHDGSKLVRAGAVFALGFVSAVQPKQCICPMLAVSCEVVTCMLPYNPQHVPLHVIRHVCL
jgi:hypothetical protein